MPATFSVELRVLLGRFADRMIGSPEIFGHEEREPEQTINFVTCHDGFTLNDLVSYNEKHNDANWRAEPRWRERQPELELRGRGSVDRSRHRAAAQPPGEKLPECDAPLRGRAHDQHG
jgi:hypothetical protein